MSVVIYAHNSLYVSNGVKEMHHDRIPSIEKTPYLTQEHNPNISPSYINQYQS